MPDKFISGFARGLAKVSHLPVLEASNLAKLEPGRIYVAPGGFHTRLERKGDAVYTILSEPVDSHPFRPSIDVLFESAARIFGDRVMAIVLTGLSTGDRTDGVKGCLAVEKRGGVTLGQNEDSSPCWGMVESCIRAHAISHVAGLAEIPKMIRDQTELWLSESRTALG